MYGHGKEGRCPGPARVCGVAHGRVLDGAAPLGRAGQGAGGEGVAVDGAVCGCGARELPGSEGCADDVGECCCSGGGRGVATAGVAGGGVGV